MHNTIIYEEVIRKAKTADLLSEVSRTIVSDHYLKEILQLITMTYKGNGFTIFFMFWMKSETNYLSLQPRV